MESNFLQKSRKKPFWSYAFFVFGVLLLIFILSATLFGLIFLQSVDESLDTRKQAQEIKKRVDFNTYPFSQSFFQVGETSRLELQVNTFNHFVDALELNLLLKTDPGLWQVDDVKIIPPQDQGLKLVQSSLQQTECEDQADCYLLTLLLISQETDKPFTSHNLSTSIASIEFTPLKEGAVNLELTTTSQAIAHDTAQNILQHPGVNQFNYYISDNGIDFAQCRYVYDDWSDCQNFWQTRNYQVAPLNCHWHQQETLEPLSQQCLTNKVEANNISLAAASDFFLHYFAPCLAGPNSGEKFYLVWNTEKYDGFAWLDVSLDHQFTDYYQKSIKKAQKVGPYTIIDLTGLTGFSQDIKGQILSFEADQNYYFRLYNDQAEQFVLGPKLYLNYCVANASQNLNCQDTCVQTQQGSSCAPGLACINSQCRLESNPDSPWCFNADLVSDTLSLGRVAGVSTQVSDASYIIKGPFLPSEAYDITTYACNHGCNTNRDCMADYRCYQGRCRLASNPESATCDSTDIKPSPQPTAQATVVPTEPQPSIEVSPSVSPTVAVIVDETETETGSENSESENVEEVQSPDPSPTIAEEETEQNQASGGFSAAFAQFSSRFNWQYLALAGLLIIIAIVFITLGLSHNPKQKQKQVKDKKAQSNDPVEVEKTEDQEVRKASDLETEDLGAGYIETEDLGAGYIENENRETEDLGAGYIEAEDRKIEEEELEKEEQAIPENKKLGL